MYLHLSAEVRGEEGRYRALGFKSVPAIQLLGLAGVCEGGGGGAGSINHESDRPKTQRGISVQLRVCLWEPEGPDPFPHHKRMGQQFDPRVSNPRGRPTLLKALLETASHAVLHSSGARNEEGNDDHMLGSAPPLPLRGLRPPPPGGGAASQPEKSPCPPRGRSSLERIPSFLDGRPHVSLCGWWTPGLLVPPTQTEESWKDLTIGSGEGRLALTRDRRAHTGELSL